MSARAALGFLFVSALVIGLTAAVLPRTFYDDFPFLRHWVELLPPYNEHLVTDVGGLYLGFAVLFAWAAWTLQPTLVRAVCSAWLLTAGDWALAEDLVQTALGEVWRRWGRVAGMDAPDAYAHKVVVNAFLRWRGGAGRARCLPKPSRRPAGFSR